jgi:KaiC/GvpD/RAD55 family RecA-like ATPase
LEDTVRIPLLYKGLPGGLRYGANYLVEFEPQSLWFEMSLTLCAQALRMGIRTDYHVFTHISEDIRAKLGHLGLDVAKLESDDTFRIIDSYSVQTGRGPAQRVGKTTTLEWVDLKSMSMDDWNFSTSGVLKAEVPEVDKRRFHIDDNTSVLVQFNNEKSVAEHFRTHTIPFARHLQLAAIHAVATGIFSDSFYRQFESFCDGIIDVKAQEVRGRMSYYMRVRKVGGEKTDSAWQ